MKYTVTVLALILSLTIGCGRKEVLELPNPERPQEGMKPPQLPASKPAGKSFILDKLL